MNMLFAEEKIATLGRKTLQEVVLYMLLPKYL